MNRNRTAALIHLALLPIIAGGFTAAAAFTAAAPVGGWIGDPDTAARTYLAKPYNSWTTADLAPTFPGCVELADQDRDRLASAYVVKFNAGRPLEVMPHAELVSRIGVFGGTPDTSDDVAILGICYS